MIVSVSSQLSKLIQMQETNNTTEAAQVRELQKELNIETDKRVNAESQLEEVQQDHTITTEELINQLETAKKDYISATEELATSHVELNESRNRHAEVEQQMMLLEQETKGELSTAEETVKRAKKKDEREKAKKIQQLADANAAQASFVASMAQVIVALCTP